MRTPTSYPRWNRVWRADQGAAATEFAMILPLLVLLAIGFIEVSRMLQYHHMINKSVHDAAHYLARVQDPTRTEYQTAARNLAMSGTITGTPLLLSNWNNPGSVTIQVLDVPAQDPVTGVTWEGQVRKVVVTAVVPITLGFGLVPMPTSLTVSHEERYLGG